MNIKPKSLLSTHQIIHNHKNDYLNDRLNAQRLLAVISLCIPLALFLIYLVTPHTSDSGSRFVLIDISLIVIAIASFRLFWNWKKPRKNIYQLTCALLDFLAAAAILIGYALTYDVPISIALKSPTANVFFIYLTSRIVLFHGQILIKTCMMAIATWLALLCLAVVEPQYAGRTTSYIEYLTSFKILFGAEVERLLQFVIITALLYIFIHGARHDASTGFLRRPFFLQSISKFLSHAKRKQSENIHALIEVRITDLANTDNIYNAVFKFIPDLPSLADIYLVTTGRLSNLSIALWISYSPQRVQLGDLVNSISAELNKAAILHLGTQAPPFIIGATVFDLHSSSQGQLTYTDIAIKEALSEGKKALIFDEKIQAKITHEHHIEQAIKLGLTTNLFSVHYQPIIDLMTDRPVGLEALIRLRDKNGEYIAPTIFIPIAENLGLISDITDHLCDIIAKEAALIKAVFFNQDIKPYININISPLQLGDIDRTISALERARAGRLTINVEITETSVLNERFAQAQITKLNQAGFSVAIDDFGTGYSSIHRLNQLSVSTLKIDQSFVENIEDSQAYSFLNAVVNLSRTASDNVIVEGVETLSQKILLMKMGVRFCQGYLFGKPMTVDLLENHLLKEYGIKKTSQTRISHIASFHH